MFGVSPRIAVACGLSAGLVASAIALASADDQHAARPEPSAMPSAMPRPAPTVSRAPLMAGFDPLRHERQGDTHWTTLVSGARAELTLDAGLQSRAQKVLTDYEVPYGALVAIEPATGRVLAYVSHSSANPQAGDLARDPTPPAASVFKIVTGSALVDAGIGPDTRVCFGGGHSRLMAADLLDDPRRDRACAPLSQAMGDSINTVFAKLASRNLEQATLRRYAAAFGFGQKLPFDAGMTPSPAEVPDAPLEFARTAAGFWHVHMSPLHGALIAATIANDGVMQRASMIERVHGTTGKIVKTFSPETFRVVLPRATARTVGRMMQRTVSDGTSHSAFFDERGRPYLPGIEVAGKTGSLSAETPYRGYSWWVGFAPADKPTIAVAALVVNTPKWRIKSSYLAREALREYLITKPARDLAASAEASARAVIAR